jgi:hypothetical protein
MDQKKDDIENKGSNDNKVSNNKNTNKTKNDEKEDSQPPPYTYEYIDNTFSNYTDNNTNNSNIIDIIGVYIKGQKILYIEAKTTCEQRLTFLMIPSILFTVACSILNLLLKDYVHGNIITSVLNGFVAFILALINYLKLDARAEAHRGSAYKYDKLLTYIEFQSFTPLKI